MVTAIRITDAFLIQRITEEQQRTGEGTAVKTASRLISERLAQMEFLSLASKSTVTTSPQVANQNG
jgi:hypothetical protein